MTHRTQIHSTVREQQGPVMLTLDSVLLIPLQATGTPGLSDPRPWVLMDR